VVETVEVVDAEIVDDTPEPPAEAPAPPKVPETATQVTEEPKAAPETRGAAKAAVALSKGQGYYSSVAEAMQAEDIPLNPVKWSAAQCERIEAIVSELRPEELVIHENEEV